MCVGVIDGDREAGKAVIINQQERHPQCNILIARVATVHIVSIVMAMGKMSGKSSVLEQRRNAV